MTELPRLAVFKMASCDGCQLSLLDCEDELLAVAGAIDIAYFPEATRKPLEGTYDLGLIEGSVTTAHDRDRLQEIRERCRTLITIGACATSGGIQALKNFVDVDEYVRAVYATPAFISTLQDATPIEQHVAVDFELRGCPIDKGQLLDVIVAFLHGRPPVTPSHSVCVECKMAGQVCVTVTRGQPCLGPVTHAGCGALCPGYARGCFGCFGPKENANPAALSRRLEGRGEATSDGLVRLYRTFNTAAPAFQEESVRLGGAPPRGAEEER